MTSVIATIFAAFQWIGGTNTVSLQTCGAPYVGKDFRLAAVPAKAELTIAVAGWAEVYVNGRRLDDLYMWPVTGQPDATVAEKTVDVTALLREGDNELAVLLGNGWFTMLTGEKFWGFGTAAWHNGTDGTGRLNGHVPPMVRASFAADGKTLFGTDSSWRAWDSPIVFNQLRNGEFYDARIRGRANERRAEVLRAPAAAVVKDDAPACRAYELYEPASSWSVAGATVYDFGHNLAGWCEIEVEGEAGAKVTIDYDECLATNRTLLGGIRGLSDAGSLVQHDEYTLAGGGLEKWHPRFVYHGFRYAAVQIEGRAELKAIRQRFVHSAIEEMGTIETTDADFARLMAATKRSYLSNCVGTLTDCPHREKNGWTGDAQLACEVGLWNFGSADVYRHFLRMMIAGQRPNGAVACILPATHKFGYGWGSGPAWDAVLFEFPKRLYWFTGDDGAAREAYPAMKKYLAFLETKLDGEGLLAYGLGDWCCANGKAPVSVRLTDSAYLYFFRRELAFWAERFGEPELAVRENAAAEALAERFNRAFYRGDGQYLGGEWTALAAPLYFKGLCRAGEEKKVAERLVAAIRAFGHRVDYGILGAKWIPRVLCEYGYAEDAWKLFTQHAQPGYQWWLDQGEDTLWETWEDGASHNHIMFGDLAAWAYEWIAGIRILEPGFAKYELKPIRIPGVGHFKATVKTPAGVITSGW